MIVGIDLGTTHSLVAAVVDGAPRVLADAKGRKLVPSVVWLPPAGAPRVGWDALEAGAADPDRLAFSFKRLMGRGRSDLERLGAMLPFDFSQSSDEAVRLTLGDRAYTPVELSVFILRHLKAIAEAALGVPVDQAVITVPAYFDDAQRQATLTAAELAGLSVARLVNEPTAACLAYGLDRRGDALVAVYDMGGGTFDCSVLRLAGGVFEVLATHGDTALGGDDLDAALMLVVSDQVLEATGVNMLDGAASRLALRRFAGEAKQRLSDAPAVEVPLALPDGRSLSLSLERADLEHLACPILARTRPIAEQALADARMRAEDLDAVVLVGGATRMPLVKSLVAEWFGHRPDDSLDPDEVVALGAAVQADILAGRRTDMLLLDVVPLSLGIETMGGAVSRLIERNSPIPTAASETFTTYADGQTAVDLHVVQGERDMARDGRSLARFQIPIPPQPAGMARVEVRFAIDANGVLTVTATDLRSGEVRSVTVRPSYGLTEQDMAAMHADAEAHAAADAEARERIEARQQAETLLIATRKGLADPAAAALDPDEREELERLAAVLAQALEADDALFLREAAAKLDRATQHLAELVLGDAVGEALSPEP